MQPEDFKYTSTVRLAEMGIRVPESLPTLETMDELAPQPSIACARRVAVLTYIVGFGFGADSETLRGALAQYDLLDYCSHRESSLFARELSRQEVINCTWLTECIQAFAWAFGRAELNHLQSCDDDLVSKLPAPYTDPAEFIQTAELRPFGEIYQMADLHYRMHWAARDARLHGRDCALDEGAIAERRKALDWIIGVDEDWDEIPLDT